MAKYAKLEDILDEAIEVKEEDLLQADRMIDNHLRKIGINPEAIENEESKNLLKDIAVKYACYVSSTREAIGDNTILLEKAKQYEKQYKDLLESISESSFPELKSNVNLGTVRIVRG